MRKFFALSLAAIVAVTAAVFGGYVLRNYSEGRKAAPEGFVMFTKMAPLFYAPDIDPNEWQAEVKTLEALGVRMDKLYSGLKAKGRVPDQFMEYESVSPYPVDFLSAIPDVMRKTDAFYAEPNMKNARRLLDSYRRTSEFYHDDAIHFSQLSESAFRLNPPDGSKIPPIVFVGSASTPKIIRNDAEVMVKNAETLESEVDKRDLCLRGGSCEFTPEKITIANRPPISAPTLPGVLKYFGDWNNAEIRGPFFYPSTCWNNVNGAPAWELLYAIYTKDPAGKSMINAKLATENYYTRVTGLETSSVLRQEVLKQGVEFVPTNEANPRRCTDLGYLQALPTMNWLKDSISSGGSPADLGPVTKRLEETYGAATYPSWDVALELKNAYENYILAGGTDQTIIRRYQTIRGELADFPAALVRINSIMSFFLNVFERDKTLPFDQVIQTYSFYSLLFLNSSEAVWLNQQKPEYLLKSYRAPENADPAAIMDPSTPSPERIFKLSVMKKSFTDEEILKMHQKSEAVNSEFRE